MTDKIIVTNLTALKRKYGAGLKQIRSAVRRVALADKKRGIRTRLVALDNKMAMKKLGAAAVTDAGDPEQNKNAIDGVFRKLAPEYLVILGAVDVVPHQDLANPVFDGDDDPDRFAYSDIPYACEASYSTKPQDFIAATRVVGRIPDATGRTDPAYIVELLQTAATWRSRPYDDYSSYLGFSTQTWEKSTRSSLRKVFGTGDDLQLSPPRGWKWPAAKLARRAHFINCHGAAADFHFYGERKSDRYQPVSHTAQWIDGKIAEGTVVAAECCYGSELYDPALASGQPGICSTYLDSGAYGFLGATTIAYGPNARNDDADLMCQFFLRRVLAGASLGRAFLEARQEFAQSPAELDPFNIKTLAQFTLLGDPSIQPVDVEDDSTPHAARRRTRSTAKTAAVASAERAERRRRLMSSGLAIERTQPRAVRSGRIRVPPRLQRALLKLARDGRMQRPRILSFQIKRPAAAPRATAAKALARKSAAPARFHVVLGKQRGKGVTPAVAGIVATEVAGVIVSTRVVFRR